MGQLNNLFVSSSYQGLLKMTDSTNGLTNTLQTVQTGDGDNSPLQMSLTAINISGSFYLNGVLVTGTTSGTSGTSGSSGSNGTDGSSGTSGSSGSGFTYNGIWDSGTTYNVNDVVSYGGQSYLALSSNTNKQPSVWPAIWQVFSAAGTSGSSGTSGSNGTDGSSGSSGSNGSSGSSGSSGSNGSSGTSGATGASGSSGTSGTNGSSGTSGLSNVMTDTIYNATATTLLKGTPVYVSGSQGANPKVYPADAADPNKMPVAYVVQSNIGTASTGEGIILGHIEGIDLTGYVEGQAVYVAAGGGWTATRPTGSATIQFLGEITKSGSGGKGLVLNPGPATLPNIATGKVWMGNGSSYPSEKTPLEAGLITTGSVGGSQSITGSLDISGSLFNLQTYGTINGVNMINTDQNGSSSFALQENGGAYPNLNLRIRPDDYNDPDNGNGYYASVAIDPIDISNGDTNRGIGFYSSNYFGGAEFRGAFYGGSGSAEIFYFNDTNPTVYSERPWRISYSDGFPLYVSGTIRTQRVHLDGNPFNSNPASNLGALRFDATNQNFYHTNYDRVQNTTASIITQTVITGSAFVETKLESNNRGSNYYLALTNQTGTGSLTTNVNTIITGSLRVSTGTTITGSLVVSGSNTLIGNKYITGSVFITGSKTIVGTNTISGSLIVTGSSLITGSVQGNVSALSISSNTASLNLNNGNFFTLQLVSGSNTRIEPSNIKPGQTVSVLLNTTGSATVTFPTSVKQVSGSAYVPTTTTGVDVITLISFDSSSLYLANVKNLI